MDGTNTLDYIKVRLMTEAMESLLSVDQRNRVLLAAEWGGFDAGMTALKRVSEQMATSRSEAGRAALDTLPEQPRRVPALYAHDELPRESDDGHAPHDIFF